MPMASVLPVHLTEELSGLCPETREGRLPLDPCPLTGPYYAYLLFLFVIT